MAHRIKCYQQNFLSPFLKRSHFGCTSRTKETFPLTQNIKCNLHETDEGQFRASRYERVNKGSRQTKLESNETVTQSNLGRGVFMPESIGQFGSLITWRCYSPSGNM